MTEPLSDRKDFLASPWDRRRVWATIAATCLEDGRIEWAKDALAYANADDPPRTWPADHPANAENTLPWPKPTFAGKLMGRSLLKVIEWKGRFRAA